MSQRNPKQARILMIDDQEANLILLEDILTVAGYTNLHGSTDPREIKALFHQISPDLILLDLHMPFLSGFEVMSIISGFKPVGAHLPILVLTADVTTETKRAALKAGATDFLTKPFDPVEVVLRVGNLLQTRLLHVHLDDIAQLLAEKLCRTSTALEWTHIEMLRRLAIAAEYRDDNTGLHTRRVGELSAKLARVLGLSDYDVGLLGLAAPLHDVGKIAIPDNILLKPSKLTESEFEIIKTHTEVGAKLLGGVDYPLLQHAAAIALYHHERWDGHGYTGVKGDAIPVAARIVAVADVFDVLTHERPYKGAWSVQDALTEIKNQAGTQFDPEIVEAFAACCSPNIAENLGVDLERLLGAVEPRHAASDPREVNATDPASRTSN